jgi:trk system potassium uptake protein TrkA
MIRSIGIDAQISPRASTVSRILQFVRRGRIRSVHSVHNGDGELIEAEVLEATGIVGKPLRSVGLPDGVRFGAIVRGGKVVAPGGDTELQTKDRVVLFVRREHIRDVEQMFRVSPNYF